MKRRRTNCGTLIKGSEIDHEDGDTGVRDSSTDCSRAYLPDVARPSATEGIGDGLIIDAAAQ
jgi:hypothetical protein